MGDQKKVPSWLLAPDSWLLAPRQGVDSSIVTDPPQLQQRTSRLTTVSRPEQPGWCAIRPSITSPTVRPHIMQTSAGRADGQLNTSVLCG
jgi:hypothetical protein